MCIIFSNISNLQMGEKKSHISSLDVLSKINVLSCVWGSVTKNKGFWIGILDLLAPLLKLHLIKLIFISSQSVAA
jgi:hypothetical protein